jgi:hypothetical protein
MQNTLTGFVQNESEKSSGGTVTAVTGVAPIASSGGNTPAISVAAATDAALGVVKPDGTIITVAAGAITVPEATNAALGVVQVDGTTITAAAGVISAAPGAGLVAGACFLPGVQPVKMASNASNWQNYTVVNAWSGLNLPFFQASGGWQIGMFFMAGSPVIGNMVILRTAHNSLVVIDSTQVTIGGISNPTLVTPALVMTDPVLLALDQTHDYYFMIFFANNAANATIGLSTNTTGATTAPMLTFSDAGNQTTVTPVTTGALHAPLLVTGLYVG